MILLDGMIRTRRLNEFLNEFIRIHNKEQDDKASWEYFLHRVFDMSYKDFLDSLPKEDQAATKEEIAATVTNSADLLRSFDPCQIPVNQS